MKYFSMPTLVLVQALVITLIVSACGAPAAQAEPTVNAVDLPGTIVAAGSTVIAETMAAIPTATSPPPTATFTDTPAPTITLLPLPSLGVTFTPLPNGNSGAGDPCINKVLPAKLPGEPVRIRVNNSTKATLSVSVYLQQTGPQSECGYRSYTLAPGDFVVINDLVE